MGLSVLHSIIFLILFTASASVAQIQVQSQEQSQAKAPEASFSLANAVEIALSRSPKVLGLLAKLEEAKASRGATRSQFLPRLGVAAGIEKNPAISIQSERLAYGYASWNLFNGFADRRANQLASFEVAKAELELEAVKFAVKLEVEEQFFKILGSLMMSGEWSEAAKINGLGLKDARQRHGAGMLSSGDVVSFEIRQARLESELADSRSEGELAKADFNRLIGHELGQSIKFSGSIPRYELGEQVESVLKTADQRAFELRRSAIDVAKSEVEVAQWVSGVLPRVDFEARNGWLPLGERPTSLTGKNSPSTYLMVTAKMDLFSGLSSVNERRAAIAHKSQSEQNLRESSSELLSQVERHLRRLALMEQRLKIESDNSSKTAKYKDTIAREYRAGIKNGVDYVAAVDLVIEARRRYAESLLGWHSERFAIENVIGRRLLIKEVK